MGKSMNDRLAALAKQTRKQRERTESNAQETLYACGWRLGFAMHNGKAREIFYKATAEEIAEEERLEACETAASN